MSSKVSAVFRIILKVLKYCLIALVLLFVDEMCMKRDYASMPAYTAERALSQYSIYSPKVFAAVFSVVVLGFLILLAAKLIIMLIR